ncbi:MAG TPA: bifunctional glutamine-synthetase adenylyltransferase/deadenyltransferase, partial [Friedmanniella sp.]
MDRIETAQGALARRGFSDASGAERRLASWSLHQLQLLGTIGQAADPDLALATLDRLGDADPTLLDRLVDDRLLAAHVVAVVGASMALGQHLVAHPESVDALAGPLRRTSAVDLRAELLSAVGADPAASVPVATDLVGDGLRLAYRAALLRVAARDLCAPEPIEAVDGVADELSDLADATLVAALSIARAKVGPEALKTRLAVVALGKTGAQELNYLSDVDVLFVAEPVRDADGEPLIPTDRAVSLTTRMAAEMTRICSAHTAAGTIWEVDAALRPEGKAGQLVRTLASHRVYYATWAKTWEFQAMLKA